jgi:hypothetical protein
MVMAFACIAWGMAHWHQGPPGNAPNGPANVLGLLVAGYLVGCIAAVVANRQGRTTTIAILAAGTIPFLGCYIVASMATTGLWL